VTQRRGAGETRAKKRTERTVKISIGYLVSALLLSVGLSAVAHAADNTAGDAAAGKTKSAICAACHGADGNSVNPQWPNLAGQGYPYLVRQALAIKAGRGRKSKLMAPLIAALGEQDIRDVAAYFASQKGSRGRADGRLAARGARLYRGGDATTGIPACMSCHGPAGGGNEPAGFPRVAGQHAAYMVKQLRAFRSGARTTDPAKMMRSIAARLRDADIEAVAQFMAGLYRAED